MRKLTCRMVVGHTAPLSCQLLAKLSSQVCANWMMSTRPGCNRQDCSVSQGLYRMTYGPFPTQEVHGQSKHFSSPLRPHRA